MDQKLLEMTQAVCSGFTTRDVNVYQILLNLHEFQRMVYYAWKLNVGFNPFMFKNALKRTKIFQDLSEEELDEKSSELCYLANFAESMFHAAFEEIDKLSN